MGVFDRQIASALRLIEKNGETITWVSITDAVGGTAAKPAGTTETPHEGLKGVFLPIDREWLATYQTMLEGTELPAGMVQMFMGQVSGFEPQLVDQVTRANGDRLSIVDRNGIEIIDPNGEGVILYIVRLHR